MGTVKYVRRGDKFPWYKVVLCDIPSASTSNIEILERFQSKVLRMIVDAPWYVLNSLIRRDLSCPTVNEEIRRYSSHYGDRLHTHPNHLAVNLLRLPDNRCFRRFLPTDLPDRV
jgi:hypothetical protein